MWITIDGRKLEAKQGETVLQVAKRSGIAIPTLCHHEGLEPAGACRVCVVEVSNNEKSEISPACLHPVSEGMEVQTRSKRAEKVRRSVIDLLLARSPENERIQFLAKRYGLKKTTYVPRKDADLCVLCGMCIRICEKMGAAALSTAGRGAEGKVTVAFFDDASECVGCGSCAANCPTSAIAIEESEGKRTIWGRTFILKKCASCNMPTIPKEQIELLLSKKGLNASYFEKCEACRRKETADRFREVMGQ